ncbi:MAG: YIP1 family protein [Candidatus Diapherotrites archaeon]|nr:YIP1 family protein [Candidatus Diapherotrites archaeon]
MDIIGNLKYAFQIFALQAPMSKLVKKKASLQDGAVIVLVAGVIAGLIGAITSFGTSIIGAPIGALFGWIVVSGFFFILASLFGGKGNFGQFAGVASFVSAPLIILSSIPFVGGLIGLWGIYLNFLLVREFFKISAGQALVIILLPLVVIIILTVVFAGALLAGFGGGLMGGMMGDMMGSGLADLIPK